MRLYSMVGTYSTSNSVPEFQAKLHISDEDGQAIDPGSITKVFNKLVKQVGIPHLTPHGLRHAYASAAFEAGVDPKVVSQHLGHASASTTYDIYAHVIPELETEAAKKIESRLLGT